MTDQRQAATTSTPPRSRHWRFWGAVLAVAVAFLVVPPLAGVPARLIEGCAKWIAVAAIFELLSVLGFIVLFKLVFGAGMSWRRSSPASIRKASCAP